MAAGSKTLSGGSSEEVLAASRYRDHVVIQLQNANATFLGFGEDAAADTGAKLLDAGDTVCVHGPKARGAINAFSAGAALLGYETGEGLTLGSH